jgi:molecular chaperone DnaK
MNAAEDAKKKESVEVKNIAEQIIYTAEKAIKDNKDKITAEIIKGVEDKIADLKTATAGGDIALIKTATEALSNEMQKIGDAMAKAQKEAPGQTAGTEPKKDDNIKDADYKETGDKK